MLGVTLGWCVFCAAGQGLAEDFMMAMEIMYLTTQFNRWLNLQVARHLEAQASRLTPASPEGIGMSGLNRARGETDDLETIGDIATLVPYANEGSAARHRDGQTVQA
jgi:hypothetical protein